MMFNAYKILTLAINRLSIAIALYNQLKKKRTYRRPLRSKQILYILKHR